MRKFCKEKSAMEDMVARICGTGNKEAQKRVIVAYADGDKNGYNEMSEKHKHILLTYV